MEAPAITQPPEPAIPGLDAYLEPGEQVLWTGAPDPEAMKQWRTDFKVAVVTTAVLTIGFYALMVLTHSPGAWQSFIVVPGFAIFLGLSNLAKAWKRRGSNYVITDRRAIFWPLPGRGGPRSIVLPCKAGAWLGPGPGDLEILAPRNHPHKEPPVLFTFYRIRDHEAARRLLSAGRPNDGEWADDEEDED